MLFFYHIVFLPHYVIILPRLYVHCQVAILQQLYIQLWYFCHIIISILIVWVLRGGGLYQCADSQYAEGLDPTPLYLEFNFSKKIPPLYLEFNFSEKHEVNSENFSTKNFHQKSLIKFITIYYHLY